MTSSFAYFDTSVLVRRYVKEDGSDRARYLTRRKLIVCSAISPLETMSAVKRYHTAGKITDKAYNVILTRFQTDRARWRLVSVSQEILDLAQTHVSSLNVRTLDAIHLATAKSCETRFPHPLPFVTADANQRDAALKLNLEVVFVE